MRVQPLELSSPAVSEWRYDGHVGFVIFVFCCCWGGGGEGALALSGGLVSLPRRASIVEQLRWARFSLQAIVSAVWSSMEQHGVKGREWAGAIIQQVVLRSLYIRPHTHDCRWCTIIHIRTHTSWYEGGAWRPQDGLRPWPDSLRP